MSKLSQRLRKPKVEEKDGASTDAEDFLKQLEKKKQASPDACVFC